jgi:hypothetical protein
MKVIINNVSAKQEKRANAALKMKRKALERAERDLKNEMYKQIAIVSGCFGIALYENWGWRKARIAKLFKEISAAWDECSADKDTSMIEMCEQETGIAVYREGFQGDYKELKYFRPREGARLTVDQTIHMRYQQKKWVATTIFASAFLALHKLYGFGGQRILRLRDQVDEIKLRYNNDSKKIEKACFEITGVGMDLV